MQVACPCDEPPTRVTPFPFSLILLSRGEITINTENPDFAVRNSNVARVSVGKFRNYALPLEVIMLLSFFGLVHFVSIFH